MDWGMGWIGCCADLICLIALGPCPPFSTSKLTNAAVAPDGTTFTCPSTPICSLQIWMPLLSKYATVLDGQAGTHFLS